MAKIENIFDTIDSFAKLRGFTNSKSKDAIKWYKNEISKLKSINRFDLLASNKKNQKGTFMPGTMAFYFYSPKHKKTLPYYDTFPLVIFVEPVDTEKAGGEKGFYGINLHYLSPILRAKLLEKIYEYNTKKKFKLTYQLLKAFSNSAWKPCFKRYITRCVKSNFLIVPEQDLTASVFLPVASFKKATEKTVWNESKTLAKKKSKKKKK